MNGLQDHFDLKNYLSHRRKQIDGALQGIFADGGLGQRIAEAMHYSLMAGGKRLRPILCLAAREAIVRNRTAHDDSVLEVGCALEMVHTYSLIHDDLPAMDDDRLRRGNPTCHIRYDEATAILAGDALLTLAFEILGNPDHTSAISDKTRLRIIREISQAAGYQGMIEGQMRDMASEGKGLSVTDLEALHRLKTGRLIRAAVVCGALIGGAQTDELEDMQTYADAIGLAFQVKDDLLNVEGDPDLLGKQTGTDEKRQKATYPSLLGIPQARKRLDRLVETALQSLQGFDSSADPLRALAGYVRDRHR